MRELIGLNLGGYQILEQIGQGGMATVFQAYQPSMDRLVAVKILPRRFTQDASFVGRFTREARTLARLEHPHILPVHDYGEQDGITYLVMRYVEAGTLKDLLAREAPLALDEAARILDQVSQALDYAHSQGVVHRDIKPANVLMDQSGNTFLTDFGIAKLVAETAQFTASGAIIGTPAYMAPEQGMGQPVDHRCDIYGLGIVLYEMLTGRVPFQAETPLAVLLKHVNDPLPLPSRIRPDLPAAAERVILKAMAKAPGDRFQRAREMGAALQRVVAAPAVAPSRETTPKPEKPEPHPEKAEPEAPLPTPSMAGPAQPAPETPAPTRRRWPLLVGAAFLAGLLLIAGLFIVGKLVGSHSTPASAVQPEASPLLSGPTSASLPTADLGPTASTANWTSYQNGNFLFSLACQDDILWTGGDGGLVRWDLTTGQYTRLGTGAGLASNRVLDLLVDDLGVLWIATDAGINRYDGQTMTSFDQDSGLDAPVVQALYLDSAGGLWAGSRGGERGLNYFDGQAWGPPPIPLLPVQDPNVQALGGTSAGNLVVGLEDQGLARFDGQAWTLRTSDDGLPGGPIFDVLPTADALWVSYEPVLVRLDPELDTWDTISRTNIHAMVQASDGSIWFGGESNVFRLDPTVGSPYDPTPISGALPAGQVTSIREGKEGLWFGSYGGGATLFDGENWQTLTTDEGLGGNQIRAVLGEKGGAIWFLHPGTGLSHYEPDRDAWQVHNRGQGALDWPAPPAIDSAGNLWTGEYEELLYYDGQAWQRYTSPDLTGVEIYALTIGPTGVKWSKTNTGLMRHDPDADEWTTFTPADHPLIDDIQALLATSDGTLWLGGEAGVAHYNGSQWSSPEFSGAAPQYVTCLVEAPDGSLWLAADGELAHLDSDQWSYHPWPAEGALETVAVGPDGLVWAGLEGLGHFDPATSQWQIFSPAGGLVHHSIYGIHVTIDGDVWIGTEAGVSRYRPPN